MDKYCCDINTGFFALKGLTIYAVIHTFKDFIGKEEPAVCLVVKDDSPDEGLAWYIHALEIVLETIEFVLASDDPKAYSLSWSS